MSALAEAETALSLEEAIQQIINLGTYDPLTVARQIEERYEADWIAEQLFLIREDVIREIARQRINGGRKSAERSAMTALRKGQPVKSIMLHGEWIPNTGWKRLADWTAADFRSKEEYYRKMSGTAARLANWCGEVAELMEADKVSKFSKLKNIPLLEEAEADVIQNGKHLED